MDDFNRVKEDAEDAANRTADVFEQAGERISQALETAARSGELSFNRMAESILQDLARTAISDLIIAPLSSAISGIGQSKPGAMNGPVNITMNLSGVSDARGLEKSKGQIASGLARAVQSGQRYL